MNAFHSRFELCFRDQHAPIFKQKVKHASSPLSSTEYRQHYMCGERRHIRRYARASRSNSFTPSRSIHAGFKMSLFHINESFMVCCCSNLWFCSLRDFCNPFDFNLNKSEEKILRNYRRRILQEWAWSNSSIEQVYHWIFYRSICEKRQKYWWKHIFSAFMQHWSRFSQSFGTSTDTMSAHLLHTHLVTPSFSIMFLVMLSLLHWLFPQGGSLQSVTKVNEWHAHHCKDHLITCPFFISFKMSPCFRLLPSLLDPVRAN